MAEDQLLDEAVMGEIVKQASADETRFLRVQFRNRESSSARSWWQIRCF